MVKIGIIGEVSVGKSTLLNALVSRYLSSTSLKRTTYVPFIFKNSKHEDEQEYIEETIKEANEEKKDIEDIIEFKTKISFSKDDKLILIDFAGVNDGAEKDSKMENVFFNHLSNLDVVLYITDSNSSMTLKSERDFFIKLTQKINENNEKGNIIKLVVVFNKYDDTLDDDEEDETSEVDEIIDDAIEFMSDYMTYESFKISAQKMMVKNIIKRSSKALSDIPKNVLQKILSEYHGKRKALKLIKKKKLEKSDIDEIEYTKQEEEFIDYLGEVANSYNHEINIYNHIKSELDDETQNHSTIIKRLNQYEKYLNIKSIGKLFDDKYYEYLRIKSTTIYDDLINYDKFIEKNTLCKFDKNNMFMFISKKMDFGSNQFSSRHGTAVCLYSDIIKKFINDKIYNFLNLKDINNKTLLCYENHVPTDLLIDNLELIIELHPDIKNISRIIDYYLIKKLIINGGYHLEHLLSLNENLNYSLINFINKCDEQYLRENIHKFYTNKSIIDIKSKYLDYEPLNKDYEIIKEKFKYYPSKMIQYLNFMDAIEKYEVKDVKIDNKKIKVVKKSKSKSKSKKKKHDIELVSDDDIDLLSL